MILWFTKKDNFLLKSVHMLFARFLITDLVVLCLYLKSFKIETKEKKIKTKNKNPEGMKVE